MDKPEFRSTLKRQGLSCDEFAALTGRSVSRVYKFGESAPVPGYALLVLRLIEQRGGVDGLLPRGWMFNKK